MVRDAFAPRPITLRSAAAQIADQIRAAIADGRLRPGDRLPRETQLALGYGVSRGTVREAIRVLSAGNLLVSSRGGGGGTFVSLPDAEVVSAQIADLLSLWFRVGDISLAEVNHARRVLEFECVRLAALNRSEQDLANIRQAVEESRDPGLDMDEYLATDIEFHTAVSTAARNRVLELAMTAVHLVRPLTNTVLMDDLDPTGVSDQHWAIYEAIRDRDPERAVRGFADHVEYLAGVLDESTMQCGLASLSLADIPLEPHPPASVLARHRPGHPPLAPLRATSSRAETPGGVGSIPLSAIGQAVTGQGRRAAAKRSAQ